MTELQTPPTELPVQPSKKQTPRWVGYWLIGSVGLLIGAVLLWGISTLSGVDWSGKKLRVVQLQSAFTQEIDPDAAEGDGDIVTVQDSDLGTLQLQKNHRLGINPLVGVTPPEEGDRFAPTVDGYTVLQGVDVSEWQGVIDWEAVAEDGIDFAIIRCGYRGYAEDGNICEDSHFAENLAGAKEAGLAVGVYFYSQAVGRDEAIEEARFVLESLDGAELDLPIFFDWELSGTDTRTDNLPSANLNVAATHFLQTVTDAGYQGGLYAYKYLAYLEYDLAQFAAYPFWLAEYGTTDFYYGYTFLQYTDAGRVDGIYGDVDRNLLIVKDAEE